MSDRQLSTPSNGWRPGDPTRWEDWPQTAPEGIDEMYRRMRSSFSDRVIDTGSMDPDQDSLSTGETSQS